MKSYRLEKIGAVTIIRLVSKPDLSILAQIIEELEEQQVSLRPWDCSVGVQLSSDDLRNLARRTAAFVPTKTGVLTSNDLAYGLARMYEVHSELEERFRVFRSEAEALNWLAS